MCPFIPHLKQVTNILGQFLFRCGPSHSKHFNELRILTPEKIELLLATIDPPLDVCQHSVRTRALATMSSTLHSSISGELLREIPIDFGNPLTKVLFTTNS